jgi:hypothetical protein
MITTCLSFVSECVLAFIFQSQKILLYFIRHLFLNLYHLHPDKAIYQALPHGDMYLAVAW